MEDNTDEMKIKDIFEGESIIEEKEGETYLGNVTSVDGRKMKNIKTRTNKGTGVVNRIMTILQGVSE